MKQSNDPEKMRHDGNFCIGTGVGIGVAGAAAAALIGATCPVCFVAAPLLVGLGVRERVKASKAETESQTQPAEVTK